MPEKGRGVKCAGCSVDVCGLGFVLLEGPVRANGFTNGGKLGLALPEGPVRVGGFVGGGAQLFKR